MNIIYPTVPRASCAAVLHSNIALIVFAQTMASFAPIENYALTLLLMSLIIFQLAALLGDPLPIMSRSVFKMSVDRVGGLDSTSSDQPRGG